MIARWCSQRMPSTAGESRRRMSRARLRLRPDSRRTKEERKSPKPDSRACHWVDLFLAMCGFNVVRFSWNSHRVEIRINQESKKFCTRIRHATSFASADAFLSLSRAWTTLNHQTGVGEVYRSNHGLCCVLCSQMQMIRLEASNETSNFASDRHQSIHHFDEIISVSIVGSREAKQLKRRRWTRSTARDISLIIKLIDMLSGF